MRVIIRTLMFLACLLQSAMPLQAGLAMAATARAGTHVSADHSQHVTMRDASDYVNKADPCPHGDTTVHTPSCAACLLLLPELVFAEKGRAPQAYPSPDLQQAFVGSGQAPPVPPPRASQAELSKRS